MKSLKTKKMFKLWNSVHLLFYGVCLIGCTIQMLIITRNYFNYDIVVAVRLNNAQYINIPCVTLSSEFLPFINHTKFVRLFPPSDSSAHRINHTGFKNHTQRGGAHQDDEPIDEQNPDFNLLNLPNQNKVTPSAAVQMNDMSPDQPNSLDDVFSIANNSGPHLHQDYLTFQQEISARIEKIRNVSTPISQLMDLLIDPQQLFKNCFVFDVDNKLWKRCLELTVPTLSTEQRRTDIHMHRTIYYTLFANTPFDNRTLNDFATYSSLSSASYNANNSKPAKNRSSSCQEVLDESFYNSITNGSLSSSPPENPYILGSQSIENGDSDMSIYAQSSLMQSDPSNSFAAQASNRGSGRLLSMKLSLPFLDRLDRGFGIRIIVHHPQLPPNSRKASKIGIVYRRHGWYALKYTHSSARLLPFPYSTDCRQYKHSGFVNKRHCVDSCVKQESLRDCNSIAFFTCLTHAELERGIFAKAHKCARREKCIFRAKLLERCEEKCFQEDCEWHVFDTNIALQTTHEQPYLIVDVMKPLAGINQIYEYRAAIKLLDVFIYIGGTLGMWFGVSLLSCYQRLLKLLRNRKRKRFLRLKISTPIDEKDCIYHQRRKTTIDPNQTIDQRAWTPSLNCMHTRMESSADRKLQMSSPFHSRWATQSSLLYPFATPGRKKPAADALNPSSLERLTYKTHFN